MPAVFADSHIVCLPSYREGMPKVLIEAASCGRPIVTTDAPGCREIVIDGENGILVPIKDVDALARAIRELLDSPDLRLRMGHAGRQLVKRKFSLATVVNETLAVYESMIQ
jgi:glycosyltransferase involved in cell wall biosynthesis